MLGSGIEGQWPSNDGAIPQHCGASQAESLTDCTNQSMVSVGPPKDPIFNYISSSLDSIGGFEMAGSDLLLPEGPVERIDDGISSSLTADEPYVSVD